MADVQPAEGCGDGALQVDADSFTDAPGGDGPADIGVASELLGHREHGEPEPGGLGMEQ